MLHRKSGMLYVALGVALALLVSPAWAADVAAAAASVTTGVGFDLQALAGHIVTILLLIFGPILAVDAVKLIRSIASHFNVNASFIQDQQVEWVVEQGINYTEDWAAKQALKPTGSEKADKCLGIVQSLLEDKAVQDYGIQPLRNLIDAKVAAMKTAAATTAAAAAVAVAAPKAA